MPTDKGTWPQLATGKVAQSEAREKPKTGALDKEGLARLDNKVWVSNDAGSVKLKLPTHAHTDLEGYRGQKQLLPHLGKNSFGKASPQTQKTL